MCWKNSRIEAHQLLRISREEGKKEDRGKHAKGTECKITSPGSEVGEEVADEGWEDNNCEDTTWFF